MAAATVSPRPERRRPRRGSLERPVNARLYRGTWLLVALPLLLAAFSVARPSPLPPANLPPTFDRANAYELARSLATEYPNRFPGSAGALGAAQWFSEQLQPYGLRTESERFSATIPGHGRVRLQNVLAVVPGRSERTIVVAAHRDDTGMGPGADDDASGTAALVELARAYANPAATAGGGTTAGRVQPIYTIIFLSTDGGAFGGLGAAEFAARSPRASDVVAVLDLDAIAAPAAPRLEIAADTPRSPAAGLVETLASEVALETGASPARPGVVAQLVDLGFPFSLYEQAPFVSRGIPAVTLTTSGARPRASFGDGPGRLSALRIGQLGRAAQRTLDALEQGLEVEQGASSFLYLGPRLVRGWAVELVLIAALLPYLAAVVDLFARCRRRRIRIAPALRSYRSRLGLWGWAGLVFLVFTLAGAWPGGAARPPSLESGAAQRWPAAALAAFAALLLLGWLVGRDRLIPRREVGPEERLAGYAGALLALGVVGLLVVATNPFALVFLLPSLHAWLWLPQARERWWARGAILAAGLAGPALLVGSFAFRYGLGLDAPWYVAELFALGYAPATLLVVGLGWLAGAAQLAALVGGRYAPYPAASERPPLGPVRRVVRALLLAQRARRRGPADGARALEG